MATSLGPPPELTTVAAVPSGAWWDLVLVVVVAVFVATVAQIVRQGRRVVPGRHDVYLAWLRLLAYACASVVLAIASGAFARLMTAPLATPAQLADPGWLLFTAICIGVEVVAYGVVWRAGTTAGGRQLHLPSVAVAGLLWGLGDALIFLVIWVALERFGFSGWTGAVAAFLLIAAFKGVWQSQYWDVRVSPEHNLPGWNRRKVLFAHIPNLAVTLAYLAATGSAAMFVAFQVLAIGICVYVMRFPAWTEIRAGSRR